jgi:phosphate transport system substrate-binding protein
MRIILAVFCFFILISFPQYTSAGSPDKLKGQVSISGAFALYPLAVRWAEEFRKVHPHVKIDISAGGAGKGITDALSNLVDIGMVSRDLSPEELKKGAYCFAVSKDAVVAIVNAKNPEIKNIISKGISQKALSSIWIAGSVNSWDKVYSGGKKAPVHAYTRSDASGAAETWAKYFEKKQEDLLGVAVFGDPGLTTAIKKDALGIGYNNLGYVYDSKTKKQLEGIVIVPLDINNNGKIDPDENFYNSIETLMSAIAADKYPSPPARELYFVTNGKPMKPAVNEFLKWILTDGQKYVRESGYINLKKDKLESELKKL